MTSEGGANSNHSGVSLNDSFHLRLSAHLESIRRVKFKGKISSHIYFTFKGEPYCTDSDSDPFKILSNCVISAFMAKGIYIILLCPLASPKVSRTRGARSDTFGDEKRASRDQRLRFVLPKVALRATKSCASCYQKLRFVLPKVALRATKSCASCYQKLRFVLPKVALRATKGCASCYQRLRFVLPKVALRATKGDSNDRV